MTAAASPLHPVIELSGRDPGASAPRRRARHEGPADEDLAARVVRAVAELQEAMDAAILAGLIVEPGFQQLGGRFASYGVTRDSFVCDAHVYRKLA